MAGHVVSLLARDHRDYSFAKTAAQHETHHLNFELRTNILPKLRRSASFPGYVPYQYAEDAKAAVLLSEHSGSEQTEHTQEPDSQDGNEEPWPDTDSEPECATPCLPLLPPSQESFARKTPGAQVHMEGSLPRRCAPPVECQAEWQCYHGSCGHGATGRSSQTENKKPPQVRQAMKTGNAALQRARAMMPAVNLQPRMCYR
ncbi:unnamed protein product [Durusdinium trenchii]|uniref:Uncharacterized protein n=1 Tax=Durusdinium trenchii TaxID=1381693 RepID=A0ABP0PG04_9DINO